MERSSKPETDLTDVAADDVEGHKIKFIKAVPDAQDEVEGHRIKFKAVPDDDAAQ